MKQHDLRPTVHDVRRGDACAVPCGCQIFNPDDLRIQVAAILRIHGYARPDEAPLGVREAAVQSASRIGAFCSPTVWYREVCVEQCSAGILTLDGGVILRCRDFAALAECQSVIVFVLTLGHALDREVRRHMQETELVEALFMETAAWLAVEQVTRAFVVSLRASLAQRGLVPTRRLAPGYADWPVGEQELLLSFLGAKKSGGIPVDVLSSGAMVPKMSRSGLYGLTCAG